jgi:hypothetical protein
MSEQVKEAATPADSMALMEIRDLGQVGEQFKRLQQFIASQMKQDVDFGIIPGTKRKSLYKPGAEKMLNLHGLACRITPADGSIIDFDRGFFHYNYKAEIFNPRSGVVIATSEGSCNSKESKYAFNWVYESKLPRGIKTDGLETRGEGSATQYKLPNNDPFSLVNTIQKMAQKRAMVGATLLACRASDIFSTEEEADMETGSSSSGGEKKSAAASGPTTNAQIEKEKISEPRLKRLYALMKEGSKTVEQLEAYLREKLTYTVDAEGKVHASWISYKHYDAACEWAKPGSSGK